MSSKLSVSSVRIQPSKAEIWGAKDGCRGYPRMMRGIPKQPSTYADEGIDAHDLASKLITDTAYLLVKKEDDPMQEHREHYLNKIMPKGSICTEEMFDAARMYVNHIHTILIGDYFGTETKVTVPEIHPGMVGYVDHWNYSTSPRDLHLWDFKYGHTLVEEWENLQMVLYVLGVLQYLREQGADLGADNGAYITLYLHIVQPRCYQSSGPIRTWGGFLVGSMFFQTLVEQLKQSALEVINPDVTTRSGKHCRFCSARHVCSSAQNMALAALEYRSAPVPVEMDNIALGTYMKIMQRNLDATKSVLTGLLAQAETIVRKGDPVPGYMMDNKIGNLEWDKPDSEIDILGKFYNIDMSKPGRLTPTQVIKAGVSEELVLRYASRHNKRSVLVEDDGIAVQKIFQQHKLNKGK